MTDYTTELLHISSYVIGILAGALLLAIALLFYYRRKLNKMCMMEDDFQPSDSENLFGKYATPIKESCTPHTETTPTMRILTRTFRKNKKKSLQVPKQRMQVLKRR